MSTSQSLSRFFVRHVVKPKALHSINQLSRKQDEKKRVSIFIIPGSQETVPRTKKQAIRGAHPKGKCVDGRKKAGASIFLELGGFLRQEQPQPRRMLPWEGGLGRLCVLCSLSSKQK